MFLKFSTKKEATSWIEKVDKILGYPQNKKFGTKTFSTIQKGANTKWYISIPDYRIDFETLKLKNPINIETSGKLVENTDYIPFV
jgi:hypothetical protein